MHPVMPLQVRDMTSRTQRQFRTGP